MAFPQPNPESEALLKELCLLTGESESEALSRSIAQRLDVERKSRNIDRKREDAMRYIEELRARVSKLPILDTRSEDEILGYDENGLPS